MSNMKMQGRLTEQERQQWFEEASKPSPWNGFSMEHRDNAERLRRALQEVDALWHLVLDVIPKEDQEAFRHYNKTFLPERAARTVRNSRRGATPEDAEDL